MSTRQKKPVGADLLRLFGPWLDGIELAAGVCLLADEPPVMRLVGRRCTEPGCQSLVCGPNDEDLETRMGDHRKRCHQ